MKVKVISLPYIFQVLYVLCFTSPRYQVSVYMTVGPLVYHVLQHSYPVRFKYVDYYDVGPVFEAFMALFKPLLSKKMQNRVRKTHIETF